MASRLRTQLDISLLRAAILFDGDRAGGDVRKNRTDDLDVLRLDRFKATEQQSACGGWGITLLPLLAALPRARIRTA